LRTARLSGQQPYTDNARRLDAEQLIERRIAIGCEVLLHDQYEDMMQLPRWLEIDRFDRRAFNRPLYCVRKRSSLARSASSARLRSMMSMHMPVMRTRVSGVQRAAFGFHPVHTAV
jgi:hypothetical protein